MRHTAYKTSHEIAVEGFEALVEKLGPGGALRFIQQYEAGRGNYTEERKRLFKKTTLAEIQKSLKKK